MFKIIKQIFTWWNGNTINTRFFTWRTGTKVGEDEFGNVYYKGRNHKDGYEQRWVIYKNYSEASTIPPGWHGWIHHRTDISPVDEDYVPYAWEKPHQPNLTGTEKAYFPSGSLNSKGQRPIVAGDYQRWRP